MAIRRFGKIIITAAALFALSALSGCAATADRARTLEPLPAVPEAEAELHSGERYRLAQDHFILARDYERRGMADMAERLYEIAHDFLPGDPYLRKILVDIYTKNEAFDKALALFGPSPDISQMTLEDKRSVSVIYLKLGDLGKAAEVLESLDADMTSEERYSLGLLYETAGDTDKALASFRAFFSGNPEAAVLGVRMAQFKIAERKLAEAESLSVILREAYPGNAETLALAGTMKYLTGDTAAAVVIFNEALAADPKLIEVWRELCYIYILTKDTENAVAAAGRFEAEFPGTAAPLKFKGYALNVGGRREEAVEALRKSLEIDSTDYFAWFELGSALERLKRIDESADAFRAVLRLRPGDAAASNYLGYMWADANINLDSAKTLIEDALEKEPENAAYLDSYAWVLYRLGDYKNALRYMMAAFANSAEDDKDPVLYEHWGDILFKLTHYEQAANAYRRSLELKTEDAKRIEERLAEIEKLIGKGR